MKATLSILILATLFLGFAFVGSALAQPEDAGAVATDAQAAAATETEAPKAAAPEKITDQGKGLYDSVKGGHWVLAFGFFGMLLGSIARFAGGKKWGFLKTKAGGYTIAAFTGLGILGLLIIEAGTFSASMVPTAIIGMTTAMALHGPAKAVTKKLSDTPEA